MESLTFRRIWVKLIIWQLSCCFAVKATKCSILRIFVEMMRHPNSNTRCMKIFSTSFLEYFHKNVWFRNIFMILYENVYFQHVLHNIAYLHQNGYLRQYLWKHTKCTKMYEMNKIVYVYKITRIPIQIPCMHTRSMHIQIWIHKFLVWQNCISISLCKRNCMYTYTNCIHAYIIHTHTNLYT